MENTVIIVLLSAASVTIAQDVTVPERRYACWGSFGPPVVSAQCPRDTVIQITRAGLKVQHHGGVCSFSDSDCGCNYGEPGCNMPNVRNLCMGRPACRLDVTQQYINTENCRGFSDYMFVEFLCVPGTLEQNTIKDICSSVADSGVAGFIRSPRQDVGNSQCQCALSTSADSTLAMTILDFRTKALNCDENRLIINGNTYCGDRTAVGNQINTDSSKVTLTYDTDGDPDSGGFWLKYEARPKAPISITCQFEAKATVKTTSTQRPTTPTPSPRLTPTRRQPSRLTTPQPKQDREQNVVQDEADEVVTKRPNREAEEDSLEKPSNQNHTPWWWRFTLRTRVKQPTTKPSTTTQFPPWFKEIDLTEVTDYVERTTTTHDMTPSSPSPPLAKPKPRLNKPLPNLPRRDPSQDSAILAGKNKVFGEAVPESRDQGKSKSPSPLSWRKLLPPGLNLKHIPPQLKSQLGGAPGAGESDLLHAHALHHQTDSNLSQQNHTRHNTMPNKEDDFLERKDRLANDKLTSSNKIKSRYHKDPAKDKTQLSPNKHEISTKSSFKNKYMQLPDRVSWGPHSKDVRHFRPINETILENNLHDAVYDGAEFSDFKPAVEVDPELLSQHELFSLFFPQGRHVTPSIGMNEPPDKQANNVIYGKELQLPPVLKSNAAIHQGRKGKNNPPSQFRTTDRAQGSSHSGQRKHRQNLKRYRQGLQGISPYKGGPGLISYPPNMRPSINILSGKYRTPHQLSASSTHIPSPVTTGPSMPENPLHRSTPHDRSQNIRPDQRELQSRNSPKLASEHPASPPIPAQATPKQPHVDIQSKESQPSAKSQLTGVPAISSRTNNQEGHRLPKAPPVLPYPSQNSVGEKESMTVTITAACVIGSILLIIIIGIVVRFVINRSDPSHALRQRHKKECALRRNNRMNHNKSYA